MSDDVGLQTHVKSFWIVPVVQSAIFWKVWNKMTKKQNNKKQHKTIPAVFSLAGAKIPKTFKKGLKTEFTITINTHTGSNKYCLLSQKTVCEWSPHCKKMSIITSHFISWNIVFNQVKKSASGFKSFIVSKMVPFFRDLSTKTGVSSRKRQISPLVSR